MKETIFISIIAMIATDTESFSLIREVVEAYLGVSHWRMNRIEEFQRHRYDIPTEKIHTFNYLIITETIRANRAIPKFLIQKTYKTLLSKRSKVIDQLESGFHLKILKNTNLKYVYLNRALIKEARQEVPLHLDYIKPIVELDRVSKKNVPKLPIKNKIVKIPLGTLYMNSHKIVGLVTLSKLVIFGGSQQKTVIGSLQHFIKNINDTKRKIIILDIGNELGGLATAIKKINDKNDKKSSLKIYRIGQNLKLNLCHTDIPSYVTDTDERISVQANFLSSVLAFAGESNSPIHSNMPQLKLKFVEAIKKIPPDELSLLNISKTDIFTHHLSQVDPLTLEQLSAEIKYYADYPELNSLDIEGKLDTKFDLEAGICLFQFPGQNLQVRKALLAFLLHKFANRCDENTIIVVPDSTQIFGGKDDFSSRGLYEEAIGQYYRKIVQKGCMVLATSSIVDLHPTVKKDIRTGIFFKFMDANDREWIRFNYSLDQTIENVEGFLQGINEEGLLFRNDDPHSIYYFSPKILEPIQDLSMTYNRIHFPLQYQDMSNNQFALLMTSLELIRNTSLQELDLIEILHEKGFLNLVSDWKKLQSSPYIISEDNREIGSNSRISISSEGQKLFDTIHRECQRLPQPLNSAPMLDTTQRIMNLRAREISNPEECNQVISDINETAGSLLSQFFELKGSINWNFFKTYLTLLEIQGCDVNKHFQRVNILESFYTQIISEKQKE